MNTMDESDLGKSVFSDEHWMIKIGNACDDLGG